MFSRADNLYGIHLKVIASFQTTLKVSRYMFRVLATTLWILGALISVFLREQRTESTGIAPAPDFLTQF
ncbi:hypothetical protein DZJ_26800 [Dickeya ananatis]